MFNSSVPFGTRALIALMTAFSEIIPDSFTIAPKAIILATIFLPISSSAILVIG